MQGCITTDNIWWTCEYRVKSFNHWNFGNRGGWGSKEDGHFIWLDLKIKELWLVVSLHAVKGSPAKKAFSTVLSHLNTGRESLMDHRNICLFSKVPMGNLGASPKEIHSKALSLPCPYLLDHIRQSVIIRMILINYWTHPTKFKKQICKYGSLVIILIQSSKWRSCVSGS